MKDLLLFSGGMDSTALCYWTRPELAVTVDYGQAAAKGEIRAAAEVCRRLEISHRVLAVDCRAIGSGEMAGAKRSPHAPVPEWWPYRNQLLATLVAPLALDVGLESVVFGAVASDAAYTDGTPDFFNALDGLIRMQEGSVRIHAPAISMSAAELIQASGVPAEILAWSHSCHRSEFACGSCRGCEKRRAIEALP